MKPQRIAFFTLGFVGLLGLGAHLYLHTRDIDMEAQTEVTTVLRALKQLDAEWNADILKSRVGINNNYDPVTTPLRAVHALHEKLAQGTYGEHSADIGKALRVMEKSFADKEELVEQFKSQNALLRNSLRYFPTAVESFQEVLSEHATAQAVRHTAGKGVAAIGPIHKFSTIGGKADRLLTDLLRFNLMPDTGRADRIARAVDQLEGEGRVLPESLRESLTLMTRHARIVLHQRVVEDNVMAQIANAGTAQTIDTLASLFDKRFLHMLQEKQKYRSFLLAYAGGLLLLLMWAAYRLVQSFRTIAGFNVSLRSANDTLEQRVQERTLMLEQQAAQLEEMATHDALTGLINRRELMRRIVQAMARAQRHERVVTLMFIDLDGFKKINDTMGHAVGDQTLQLVAHRIQGHVRKEDTLARLGGDEFVIVLNEVEERAGAVRVAEAVLREMTALVDINGNPITISASIGISSVRGAPNMSSDTRTPENLLIQADHAMYQAKQNGKNCYRFSELGVWHSNDHGSVGEHLVDVCVQPTLNF